MNLEKLFDFIKEKRGYDYPVKYKLINNIPLSKDELIINGDLDLDGTNITSLPDNLYAVSYTHLRAHETSLVGSEMCIRDRSLCGW